MQTSAADIDRYRRLEEATRVYARFSRNAAGLGNVAGGVLALGMYVVGLTLPLGTGGRLAMALVPFAWIALKEGLRHRYYQRHGRVREPVNEGERGGHVLHTALTGIICAGVVVGFVYNLSDGTPALSRAQTAGYLLFVVALPVLVWFFMWTTEEFLVGVLLVCQAAVMLAGGNYPLSWAYSFFPLFSALAAIAGVKQHRDYLRLERQLRELRREPWPTP